MGGPSGKTKKEIDHEASRLNWNITPSSPGRTKMGTGYFFMTGGRSIGGSSGAAARLGMKRTTLQSKMRKLGISRQS
jgi:DNA-binding NtrC family response regulator